MRLTSYHSVSSYFLECPCFTWCSWSRIGLGSVQPQVKYPLLSHSHPAMKIYECAARTGFQAVFRLVSSVPPFGPKRSLDPKSFRATAVIAGNVFSLVANNELSSLLRSRVLPPSRLPKIQFDVRFSQPGKREKIGKRRPRSRLLIYYRDRLENGP